MKLLPVHRFFNTKAEGHFFTINEAEKDTVIENYKWFRYEGIAFYAYAEAELPDLPPIDPPPVDPPPVDPPPTIPPTYTTPIVPEVIGPIPYTIQLVLGPFGTDSDASPFKPGEKRYYKFIVPPNFGYVRASISGFDQRPVMNMVVEKGEAVDYFDRIFNEHLANGFTGLKYIKINDTEIWDNMTNNPYGQALVITKPEPGDYYLIVRNMDPKLTSRINVLVNGK